MRIERNGTEILVGDWPSHPEQTALLEARGALLAWDVLAEGAVPAARVHDEAQAAEWLWEIYGTAAAEILGGADDVTVPADGDWRVRGTCRVLAQLAWVEAWWPASDTAGVPTISLDLLRAERAVTTSEVEHLLDDEDATARALSVAPMVDAFATRLAALADDYGVVLREVVAPSQVDYALAAGGERAEGVTVLSGTDPVDWALVPSGVVDAAADAEWAVVRNQGATYLEVAVSLVARARPTLAARFGQFDVQLDQADGFGRLTGRASVPPTVLLLPPAQRVLTVYAPDFAQPGPAEEGNSARRQAIIAYARSRSAMPTATLTERLAGQ
ncbi:hypothetical protein JOF56_004949 [Kibdelosporangium banguiense]|uniref:Uncharacterized protein n=1 Tax=Kibdelosporangium banguiense TaxID=1365924 RepID=A0ABS4TKQ3_9PSEU|nr:hypothetical protein [Kibdelosporangium banguiense]MBP2324564.1 hypothetical protein [Kibdelosporangium banguiense]